jgi:hypothetical protein
VLALYFSGLHTWRKIWPAATVWLLWTFLALVVLFAGEVLVGLGDLIDQVKQLQKLLEFIAEDAQSKR